MKKLIFIIILLALVVLVFAEGEIDNNTIHHVAYTTIGSFGTTWFLGKTTGLSYEKRLAWGSLGTFGAGFLKEVAFDSKFDFWDIMANGVGCTIGSMLSNAYHYKSLKAMFRYTADRPTVVGFNGKYLTFTVCI